MWTRAAVALKNINICEMPSHDGDLGTGRRAGCGRACLRTACVPLAVRAGWAAAFRTRGAWELCVPGPGPLWCFMSASPGGPGRALWASRARFCVPP